ncbi:hypothetical protein [Streptomyces sp. NPDC056544]|uniref:hypothetical protein n=1 Tax=unclassified Streptomyces TaxID=2593676 RepID=UPI0036C04717
MDGDRRLDARRVRGDELAGHQGPVRALHQHGHDIVAEVAAQSAGRPARQLSKLVSDMDALRAKPAAF